MSNEIELSVVIPVYNSEKTLDQLVDRIKICIGNFLGEKSFELIFVNDGSSDSSWAVIKKILWRIAI
nr:glycosyltransferase [Desulfobacula sp.]